MPIATFIVSGDSRNPAGARNSSVLFQMGSLLGVEGRVLFFEGYFAMVIPAVTNASQ